MAADRYLKAVLTIIAVELGWIALIQTATPVVAQQDATPVVITAVDLRERNQYLPVAVLGQVRDVPVQLARSFQPLAVEVRNSQPIRTSLPTPVDVRSVTAIRVDTDRPLRVENVGYTPTQRPGE